MFIEFQFGNFRSFRDIQKLTMQAAPLRSNDSGMEEGNVFTAANYRLLKTKAIYGSNASGKSNLAKALSTFCFMVDQSVSQEGLAQKIWDDRFKLLTGGTNSPQQKLAIKRAQKLHLMYSGRKDFANQCRCTTVYLLVEELNKNNKD